jgi:hypothetical protein
MVNGKTPFYLPLLAMAVLGAGVLWFQPYSAEWPGTGYTKPAQRYLRAAIRLDSSALTRLSASTTPETWALTAPALTAAPSRRGRTMLKRGSGRDRRIPRRSSCSTRPARSAPRHRSC